MHDGGIREFPHEAAHLRREGLLGGEAGRSALDGHKIAGALQHLLEYLRHRGIRQHRGAGRLVEPVGGIRRLAQDDLGCSGAGLDFAQHADACFVGWVESGNGGRDFGRRSQGGCASGDAAAHAGTGEGFYHIASGRWREAGGVGDHIGKAASQSIAAIGQSSGDLADHSGGLGADGLAEPREAERFGSGAERDEICGIRHDFQCAGLRDVWSLLLVAAGDEAREELGGRGLFAEGLVFGIDAFFGDVVLELVVFEIVVGGWPQLAAGVEGVLELDFVVVEEKFAGLFVAVFGSALDGFLGPTAELHGAERGAADAGLERGGRLSEGFGRRENGGVHRIDGSDKKPAHGLGGEFRSARQLAFGLESFLGGF